jgi:glucose/arabinose dehydrogenase
VTPMRRTVLGVLFAVLALAVFAAPAAAVKKRLVGNFDNPVQVAAPSWVPASTIYVVEQPGQIVRRQKGGQRNVVLNIKGRVAFNGQERGLLSVAFGPKHKMWVYFTNNDGDLRVVRYTLTSGGGHVKSGSAHTVFRASHSSQSNHNGGTLQFHAGHLFLSTGDGGGGCNDGVPGSAQNLGSKLGKLLRKDANGWKVVGYGLRNPWRWSFDRANGDLYIGDVGQQTREEVDFLPASKVDTSAENYGWNVWEGNAHHTCPDEFGGLKGPGDLIFPKYDYGRGVGSTVIGGFVYRGKSMPGQRGRYFFGDLGAGGWIKTADARTLKNRHTLGFRVSGLTSFGENSRGELYATSGAGGVYKLVSG